MRFDPPCRIHPSSGGAFCGQPGRGAPWSRRQLARRQRKGPGRTAPRHPEKPARQPTAQSPPPGRVHGNAGSPVYSLRHNVAGGGSPRLRPSRRNFGRADTAPQPIRGGYRPRNSHRCFHSILSTRFGCNRSSTKQIIATLRRQFRCLIIATGPIDSSSTPVSIAALSTGTVLVAEARISDIAVIRDCIQRLRDAKVTLSGAVLTNYSGSSPPWTGRAPAP